MINLGLKRTTRLLDHIARSRFGQAQFNPPWKAVHIAGTNGKGSVAAYLSALIGLQYIRAKDGTRIRVGRFTSPHFIDRWDCIQINDRAVERDVFLRTEREIKLLARDVEQELRNEVLDLNEGDVEGRARMLRDVHLTEFEILTATAFTLFSEPRDDPCDIAVIECGLGGRLDATNVLPGDAIVASVITRIGLDHLDMLGGSLRSIVREKCGIIRDDQSGVVVVDGDNDQEVLDMIHDEFNQRFGLSWRDGHHISVVESRGTDFDHLIGDISEARPERDDRTGDLAQPLGQEASVTGRVARLMPHQKSNLQMTCSVLRNAKLGSQVAYDNNAADWKSELWESVLNAAGISYPARLQWLEPGWLNRVPGAHTLPLLDSTTVLLDGAHNAQSAIVLADAVQKEMLARWEMNSSFKAETKQQHTPTSANPNHPRDSTDFVRTQPIIWILAFSSTKSPHEILATLFNPSNNPPHSTDKHTSNTHASALDNTSTSQRKESQLPISRHDHIIFTSFSPVDGMPWVHPALQPALLDAANNTLGPRATISQTEHIIQALDQAESQLRSYHELNGEEGIKDPLVVVAGSLYLASDFLRFVRDGRDNFLTYWSKSHC